MAEQWIDAATARTAVASASDTYNATRALCIRAHSDMIAAKGLCCAKAVGFRL